jgi:HD superfamily phosphodiesterase
MNLAENIESAEIKYRQILENYFITTWGKTILYSHDIDHHRRVWHYTKELLREKSISGEAISSVLPEKLIIASYLHDLGMSIDPGIRHGILSRELCKSFLKTNNLYESEHWDVLKAIEYHDDKDYKISGNNKNELLKILSVADDLDAFGFIGIYRYLEIYLTRGIQPEIIGYEIRENAQKRFQNLESTFGVYPGLIERHRKRFHLLDDFLANYNRQIEDYSFNQKSSPGYVNIIDLLSGIIQNKIPPQKIKSEYYGFSNDQSINDFIGQLSSELKES